MITLLRSRERLHYSTEDGDLWRTFASSTNGVGGFQGLAHFDEETTGPAGVWSQPTGDGAEVILYVCTGAVTLFHDGTTVLLAAGTFLHLPAGPGGRFQVRSVSGTRPARLFRIGLVPLASSLVTELVWKWFSLGQRRKALWVVAARDGGLDTLQLAQHAVVCSAVLSSGRHVVYEVEAGHGVWFHVVMGRGRLGGLELGTGDGAGMVDEHVISFTASEETEVLLVDLPQ